MGQGADCKVIDFNFMFSRDCVDCDAASAAAQMEENPYGTPRLTGLPQDIVRFNARAEMHAAPASYRRPNDSISTRPLHNALNRLREADTYTGGTTRRYEDPSYENVHVQWQNGFEFGRSRDYDHSLATTGATYQSQSPVTGRAPLQRARSESPTLSGQRNTQSRRLRGNVNSSHKTGCSSTNRTKFKDSYRNYELNTFKPKLSKAETLDIADNHQVPSGQNTTKNPVTTNQQPITMPATAQQQEPIQSVQIPAIMDDSEGAVGGIEIRNETSSASILPNIDISNVDAGNATTSDNDNMPILGNSKINSPNNITNNE